MSHAEYQRQWRNARYAQSEEFRERERAQRRRRRAEIRQECFEAYGGRCACCGEIQQEFLSIDHINGGGNKHRKEVGGAGGGKFYRWLRRNGWPQDEFQLLCFNCNMAKAHFGTCPHGREV